MQMPNEKRQRAIEDARRDREKVFYGLDLLSEHLLLCSPSKRIIFVWKGKIYSLSLKMFSFSGHRSFTSYDIDEQLLQAIRSQNLSTLKYLLQSQRAQVLINRTHVFPSNRAEINHPLTLLGELHVQR